MRVPVGQQTSHHHGHDEPRHANTRSVRLPSRYETLANCGLVSKQPHKCHCGNWREEQCNAIEHSEMKITHRQIKPSSQWAGGAYGVCRSLRIILLQMRSSDFGQRRYNITGHHTVLTNQQQYLRAGSSPVVLWTTAIQTHVTTHADTTISNDSNKLLP